MAVIVVATAFPLPEHREVALDGKLSAPMDVQVLAPIPAGSPVKGAL